MVPPTNIVVMFISMKINLFSPWYSWTNVWVKWVNFVRFFRLSDIKKNKYTLLSQQFQNQPKNRRNKDKIHTPNTKTFPFTFLAWYRPSIIHSLFIKNTGHNFCRLAQNQDNMSEWGDMSIRRLQFQWDIIIKIQLRVGLVQSGPHHYHIIEN